MNADDIVVATADRPDVGIGDGEAILTDGVRSHALFVLVAGTLEVRRAGQVVATIDEPGAVVGELGLLLGVPATADVVAVGSATVRRIDDAEEFFVRYPGFSRYLATLLARRLWQVSTYLSDLQAQFADRSDILGLVPTVLEDLLGSDRPEPDLGSDREDDSPY